MRQHVMLQHKRSEACTLPVSIPSKALPKPHVARVPGLVGQDVKQLLASADHRADAKEYRYGKPTTTTTTTCTPLNVPLLLSFVALML